MITGRDTLLTEKRGHIYILTINREERRNASSLELSDRLGEEWERFDEDEDLWVLILTAKGDVAFSAGHDMKEDVEGDVRGGPRGGMKQTPRRKPHPWVSTWKPTIAAINGYALAGGWELAQRCDVRIAAEHATFGIPEIRWNLPAGFGAQLSQLPTWAIAAEMLLWGRPISAQRAYEIGFVNKVVPKERLMEEASEWAEYMCTLGQESVRGHKRLLHYARFVPPSEIQTLAEDIFYWWPKKRGVVLDEDVGARAFAEKRQPDFSDQFNPPKFHCPKCGSEYVVSKNRNGSLMCCGEMAKEGPLPLSQAW